MNEEREITTMSVEAMREYFANEANA